MRYRVWHALIGSAVLAIFLTACGPSDKEIAAMKERERLECLDKICEGDAEPHRDPKTEELLKINGQWFIGPQVYFSAGMNGAAFYWPSKHPFAAGGEWPEKAQPFYDTAVEIFLRSHPQPLRGPRPLGILRQAESEGRLISKTSPREGLEAWRIRENNGLPPEVWYVATNLKDSEGDPPILACGDRDPKFDRCSMGFMWQPGIAADVRFRARHGVDWPEIHQEIVRVLSLLRKG